jgi:hypothetical protein
MRRLWLSAALGALVLVFAVGAVAIAGGGGGGHGGLKAHLSGYQEVPAINSPATGRFKAKLNGSQIDYKLSYSGFVNTPTVAHIHFGQFGVSGGIFAFLCGGGGKPDCPPAGAGGEVTGTIVAGDVQAIPAQNVAAGDFDALLGAIRHGVTYVNVHTDKFTAGEIRGQIGGKRGHFGFGQKGEHGSFGQGGSDKGGHDHGGHDD